MNWYFSKIAPQPESIYELVKDYSDLLAEGLQEFIDNGGPTLDVQPEAFMSEWPSETEAGFRVVHHPDDGMSYRYSFSVGGYHKVNGMLQYVKYSPVPYDISIERADGSVYASDADLKLETRPRVRIIDKAVAIA